MTRVEDCFKSVFGLKTQEKVEEILLKQLQ